MAPSVGIVVPAYKPDPNQLAAYLDAIDRELSPAALHVELDAAPESVLDRLSTTPATVRAVPDRRGKGAAITAGFDRLGTDILAFVDADGSTATPALGQILAPVRNGRADLAVGSRRHPDASVTIHQSRVRRRMGDALVKVARAFLPVALYDYQCGAKAITRPMWERVRQELVSPGFAWDIDLIVEVDGAGGRIVEVPIEWEDRPGSTVPPLRVTGEFARAVLRGWHRERCRQGSTVHRYVRGRRSAPPRLVDRPGLEADHP